MASITLAGTLLDPNSDLSVGDEIRFTHQSTTGQTVKSAVSLVSIPPNGTYSVPLQYGLVLVEYKDIRSTHFKNLGIVTVNGSTTATSIPEILNSAVPVTNPVILEMEALITDARDSYKNGVLTFSTYALLTAFTPATLDHQLSSFKVTNDSNTSLNGYYSWVSGTTYTKNSSLFFGEVVAGDVEGVEGGKIRSAIDITADRVTNYLDLLSVYNELGTENSYSIIEKTLVNVGDYVELQAQSLSTSASDDAYLLSPDASFHKFGWLSDTIVGLRLSSNTVQFNTAQITRTDNLLYKLVRTSDGYELFIGGLSQGTVVHDFDFSIKYVSANLNNPVYSSYKISNININVSGVLTSYTDLAAKSYSVNVDSVDLNAKQADMTTAELNIATLTSTIDILSAASNKTSLYNSTADVSSSIIDKTLSTTGDYLEITARGLSSNVTSDLTYFVNPNVSFNRFAFINSTTFQLRLSGASTSNYDITGVVPTDYNVYKLVKTSTGYELFLNSVSKGDIANAIDFNIYTFGANTANNGIGKWEIDSATINISGASTLYTNLSQQPYSTNVLQGSGDAESVNSECYIRKELSISATVPERIHVYTLLNGPYYTHFYLDHEVDTSTSKYKNYWRIAGGYLAEKTGSTFIETSTLLLDVFESEQVFQITGKTDATGGVHGDERIDLEAGDNVSFYVAGVLTALSSISETVNLGCGKFEYVEVSHMYETDNAAHPIVAEHTKKTSFVDNGFETNNIITLTAELNMFLYSALFCIGKNLSEYVSNENYVYEQMTGGGLDKLSTTNPPLREYFGYNETTGFSSYATSKLFDSTDDLSGSYYVRDRGSDSKYYRVTATDTYPAGKTWRSFGKIRYFKTL